MWQTGGGAKQSYQLWWPSLTKDMQTEHELICMNERTLGGYFAVTIYVYVNSHIFYNSGSDAVDSAPAFKYDG